MQDASAGQGHEIDKHERPQFVENVLDRNSQTRSEDPQSGDSHKIAVVNKDLWERDPMRSPQSTLPIGNSHSPAANSCQSNSAVDTTANVPYVEDATLVSGGLHSEVVSSQSMGVKENGPVNSSGYGADCYVLQYANIAGSSKEQTTNADCYSGTAPTMQAESPAVSLCGGGVLVNSVAIHDENHGMCNTGECMSVQDVHISDKGFCNIVREESHSCDITEQEYVEEHSKDSRGPNCDSCDGPAIIQEEIVEQIVSGPNFVKKVSDMVNDYGVAIVDVYMDTRNDLEDDVESNRCVSKADEKLSPSPCEQGEEKLTLEAGNSLSVNVSSIEELPGSEEGEQVGAQSKYSVETGPEKFESDYPVSERKENRVLRGHFGEGNQKASTKDPCSKVLKGRKFAKAGKRSRICCARAKRKRNENEDTGMLA